MAQRDGARLNGSAPAGARSDRRADGWIGSILSPRLPQAERAAVTGPVSGLVAAGLVMALASPAAMMAGFGAIAAAGFGLMACGCLGAALALAAFGRSDGVLALLVGLGALPLALFALRFDSVWPLLPIPLALAESALARRALLVRLILPTLLATSALLGFLSLHGIGPSGAALAGWPLVLPALSAYAVFAAMRLRGPPVASEPVRDDATSPPEVVAPLSRIHVQDRVRYLRAVDRVRETGLPTDATIRVADGAGRFEHAALRFERGEANGAVFARRAAEAWAPVADPVAACHEKALDDVRSALLATVSHELRTPLNAIIGFADILDDELFGTFADPRQKEYVGLIRRSGHHLLSVVNGLLDMSRIEAGRYQLRVEPFSLRDVAEGVCEMLRGEAERKGLRLVNHGLSDIAMVADPQGCRQMLLNLVGNAVKFTDTGAVCLSTRSEGTVAVIEVADTGIGIAAEDLHRLGRPFEQASQGLSRRYEGTGLGLSLVKGLAELHGGSMEIRSQPGRGTTVAVRIPLDCAARPRADALHPTENVVTLTDARKKTSPAPQDHPDRRTA